MGIIDNTTHARSIGFMVWFHSRYGYSCSDTYYKLAANYGQYNYVTCRNIMLELEKAGYIKILHRGTRAQTFCLNRDRYNELVNYSLFPQDPQ